MQKSKKFSFTKFNPSVMQDAEALLRKSLPTKSRNITSSLLTVNLNDGTKWNHDSESEFFSDYRKPISGAYYWKSFDYGTGKLDLSFYPRYTTVDVQAPKRDIIEKVFEVFEQAVESSRIEPPEVIKEPPTIFIGHGGSDQWRLLKDHLSDKHDYKIDAYEIGARAGHAIRDVLERMAENSSFAILVMTGEDYMGDGKVRARQNVIHEIGLFQGTLGFSKTIVLREGNTEMPSNLSGINYIPYPEGRIKETFGDILATIKREFE